MTGIRQEPVPISSDSTPKPRSTRYSFGGVVARSGSYHPCTAAPPLARYARPSSPARHTYLSCVTRTEPTSSHPVPLTDHCPEATCPLPYTVFLTVGLKEDLPMRLNFL